MRIDRDRAAGRLADHLRDERDARRAADQQDAVEPVELEPGALDRPPERPDRLGDPRPDHLLEFLAGQAHLGLETGQDDLDRRVGIGREGLLGPAAFLAQSGDGGQRRPGRSGRPSAPAARTRAMTLVKSASSKSMPPRRSIPSGRPSCSKPSSVLRRIVASNVPPPKS